MNEIVGKWLNERYAGEGGQALNPGNMGDAKKFARELGMLLYHLERLDTAGAPAPSFENAFAGSELKLFEAEFADLMVAYKELVPADLLVEKFDRASKNPWAKAPVWLHGSLYPEQIFVENGKIIRVEGFEKAAIGDPAIDLAIAWSIFPDSKLRKIFFGVAEADEHTIDRARIYAIRNSLKNYNSEDIDQLIMSRDALTEILKDYGYTGDSERYN